MSVRSELRGGLHAGFRRRSLCRRGDPLKSAPLPQGEPGAFGVSGAWSCLAGLILLDPLGAGALEPGGASTPDAGPAAVVLVVGGDVPDRGVQSDRVVLGPDPVKLGVEEPLIERPTFSCQG